METASAVQPLNNMELSPKNANKISHKLPEESLKIYVIIVLQIQNIPKYTSQVIGRFIKPLSQPYHDLATVYSSNNPDELHTVINKYHDAYSR
jgi:hypothetical protein